MEILIATALTGIVTSAILGIVRVQMRMYEMNDQVVRTQGNARAAMDFLETMARRACGAISGGAVGVNVAGVPQTSGGCLRHYDGATVGASSITSTSASLPDAFEIVYGSGTMTALTGAPNFTSTPSVTVVDTSGFAVGDFVLVGDFANADLFQVSAVNSATRTLSLGTLASGVVGPALPAWSKLVVLKATTYTFFVAPAGTATYAGMLMVDPAGVASSNHLDFTKVMPAAEGVVDLQLAVGNDGNGDGIITESSGAPAGDEWIGNSWGETIPAPPWNAGNLATPPQLRQVRVSMLFQTMNSYGGVAAPLPTFEDRPAASYPSVVAAGGPRYRSMRLVVSPRAWNLAE
jgi:hypothetical protein